MLVLIGIFIFGGMIGFITCAFFVGANQRRWDQMHGYKNREDD